MFYKSIISKILKCNADIFFNKQCLAKNITPKYTNIKVPATSKNKTKCDRITFRKSLLHGNFFISYRPDDGHVNDRNMWSKEIYIKTSNNWV